MGTKRQDFPVGWDRKADGKEPHSFVSSLAFDGARIHAASIYCSDGRVGEQIDEFLHEGLHLPRYDRLAMPIASSSTAPSISTRAPSASRPLVLPSRT